jgi:rubrerythrin
MSKDFEEMARMSFEDNLRQRGEKYKCASCGIINESMSGAPQRCIKCENTKFFKI